MVDTARSPFPRSMNTALEPGSGFDWERVAQDAIERTKQYARDEPVTFGLIALGVGFVLGWRLKPW